VELEDKTERLISKNIDVARGRRVGGAFK